MMTVMVSSLRFEVIVHAMLDKCLMLYLKKRDNPQYRGSIIIDH